LGSAGRRFVHPGDLPRPRVAASDNRVDFDGAARKGDCRRLSRPEDG
jgi:hypothetical protein